MKENFSKYYLPKESEYKQLWRDCIFIFDTNVLLSLYRFTENTRKEFFRVLKAVSDRVWIPHQVALEYQESRLGVIAKQEDIYKDAKEIVEESFNSLKKDFENAKLTKKHSAINLSSFMEEIEKANKKFYKELDDQEKAQHKTFTLSRDSLRDRIESILGDNIGPAPESQDSLDALHAAGKKRYEQQRPPGYKDLDNNYNDKEFYYYRNLKIVRRYGDYILWTQILDEAKRNEKFKTIIFVTDDKKDDWWQKTGSKTIGPRLELLDEIYTETNVLRFHMYSSERFLEYAKENLGIQIKQETINEVKESQESEDGLFLAFVEIGTLILISKGKTYAEIAEILGLFESTIDEILEMLFEELNVASNIDAILLASKAGLFPTGRELDCLRLVAQGMKNSDIAEELRLGEGTVRNYLHSVNKKLSAKNRTDAAFKARQLGLID